MDEPCPTVIANGKFASFEPERREPAGLAKIRKY